MLVFDTSRQWAHLFLPEHICFAWAHLFCLSDVVYVVQKCIKLFHLTATTIVSFYTCTYIPVGFVVKVVGCYLKIVPSYKFSQHNKKHLRLHSKTFIINWHNSFFKDEFVLESMILSVSLVPLRYKVKSQDGGLVLLLRIVL